MCKFTMTTLYPAPDRLQSMLLAKPKAKRKPRSPDWYVGVTLALCGLASGVMAFSGWLPGGGA